MQLFLFPRSWPTRKPRNWIGNPAWVVAYDIFDVVLVVGIETTMWIRLLVAMEDEGPQIFIYSLHTPSIGKTWTIHRQWTIIAIFIGYLLSSCLGGQLRLCCGRRHVMTPRRTEWRRWTDCDNCRIHFKGNCSAWASHHRAMASWTELAIKCHELFH